MSEEPLAEEPGDKKKSRVDMSRGHKDHGVDNTVCDALLENNSDEDIEETVITVNNSDPITKQRQDSGDTFTEEINPNCKGNLDYAPLPPEECCGCRPMLPKCCYKQRLGRAYLCCSKDVDGEPKVIFLCGAGWPTQIVTFILLLGISGGVYAFAFTRTVPIHYAWGIGAFVVTGTAIVSLIMTGCRDPGIFLRYSQPKNSNWRYVSQTKSYRPPGNIRYCSESGFLVEDIDHFCPWTGNTIAKANIKCFYFFLAMICVSLAFVIAIGVYAGINTNILPGAASATTAAP